MHVSEQPFVSLIKLVELDQEIRLIQSQIETAQQEIAQLEMSSRECSDLLDRAKRHLNESKKNVDAHELLMRELDEREQEKKRRLDATANVKEYQSLSREIETIKRERHENEESLLLAWNKLEAAQREYAAQSKSVDERLAVLAEQRKEKQAALEALLHTHQEKEDERPSRESLVPDEWLEKYRHMRLTIADPVVPVIDGSCSVCSHPATAQETLRLKRSAILQCKSCYRLIYLPEAVGQTA